MVKAQSMAAARKRVRKAQEKAQEERARRERRNIEDMAAFLVARDRLAGVDAWEAQRVAQLGAEAARRRDEQRRAAAAALSRMRSRGETVTAIAALADAGEGEVRAYLKLANAGGAAGPEAVDADGDSASRAGGDVGGGP
jgi:hypothetical protein